VYTVLNASEGLTHDCVLDMQVLMVVISAAAKPVMMLGELV